MVHLSPPASYEIKVATREPLLNLKPTLQQLDIPIARQDEIEEIRPFTPGSIDKVKGWSSCRGSPMVEKASASPADAELVDVKSDKEGVEQTHKRRRRLSTHHVDFEALEKLHDNRIGDQALLEIMDHSAHKARAARQHKASEPDPQAIKDLGFLTT